MAAKNEVMEFVLVPIRWHINMEAARTHLQYFVRKLLGNMKYVSVIY
jgi:hypothetical protein